MLTVDDTPLEPVPDLPEGARRDGMNAPAGVQFVQPPEALLPSITEAIEKGAAGLVPGDLALVGIATRAGWNSALVYRGPRSFDVQLWIGSKWDEPVDFGVRVRKVIKFGKR
jgi:hypothetical protein